ncbi:MAG: hypothetical protein IT429_24875 [Gemmataceae bacterium]|nr:hypothetical protein [Gemmataceae bacterium]
MRLGRRLARLERPRPGGRLPAWALAVAAEVAAEAGVEAELVVREAEAVRARAEAAGALGTEERWAAFLVEEGVDPAALLAEAHRILGRR